MAYTAEPESLDGYPSAETTELWDAGQWTGALMKQYLVLNGVKNHG